MAAKPSEFGTWFAAQFGRLPNPSRRAKVEHRAAGMRYALRELIRELETEEALEASYRASLLAWQAARKARESKPKPVRSALDDVRISAARAKAGRARWRDVTQKDRREMMSKAAKKRWSGKA